MSSARKLGLAAAALVTFGVGAAELLMPRGPAMTAFGDLLSLALLTAVTLAFFRNSFLQRRSRIFWLLLGFGCMLWTINTGVWAYYELILKQELPEPCFGDVILFIHVVPFMVDAGPVIARLAALVREAPASVRIGIRCAARPWVSTTISVKRPLACPCISIAAMFVRT